MKRTLAFVLSITLAALAFASCMNGTNQNTSKKPVSINVVTAYGSEDGNRETFMSLAAKYEKASGNKVLDKSGTANEEWKYKINADFQTGAEPDVLMFYTGTDSNEIVRSQKLVSIDEIRTVYPDYGNNMREDAMPASEIDGKQYAIPTNGFWEGLFVNTEVLKNCGISEMPDKYTTWDEFMAMCEQIKLVGYIPIAVSLQEVPHYLFEYAVFNEGSPQTHAQIFNLNDDIIRLNWKKGLQTIKELYDKEYLPYNTLVASDTETFQLFATNKAAFVIDGSWKMGWFNTQTGNTGEILPGNVENINNFYVTYVPSKDSRKNTDIISGISMGYFITRRAWDNPEKRDACVQFVNALTSDEAITALANFAPTALKSEFEPETKYISSLHKSAAIMYQDATSHTSAVQDKLNITARNWLFGSISSIVTNKLTIDEVINTALSIPLGGAG